MEKQCTDYPALAHTGRQCGDSGFKNLEHIRANFDLFDFELTAEEMQEIQKLNKDKRYYTSTPELLKSYAEMVPSVDEQV